MALPEPGIGRCQVSASSDDPNNKTHDGARSGTRGSPAAMDSDMLIDSHPRGCECDSHCETPCWQRVGMSDEPCCDGCGPLPRDHDRYCRCNQCWDGDYDWVNDR